MELKNAFDVNMPADQAWRILLDVPNIVQCVPGAELLEKIDDTSYKGRVSVKLGPILLTFDGIAKFAEIDEAGRRARVEARGNDKKGRGSAQAAVVMQVMPAGGTCRVTTITELQLFGSIAQYGRASGLISDVSTEIVNRFADNLNRRIEASASPAATDRPAAEATHFGAAAPVPISGIGFALQVLWRSLARLLGRS